ncbi:MAG: hypothetical protein AAGE96_05670 [Cyanobacteria bacterium P01_G01_bin.19]
MIRKYLYALLICLSLFAAFVPRIASSSVNTCQYNHEAYQGLSMSELSQELSSTGLIGRIHGAAPESQMYIMSVREPNNFFNHLEFSLLPQDSKAIDTLKQLNRHDAVCVRGELIANPSPQPHIKLSSIEILEPWQKPQGFEPYQRQENLPDEIKEQTSLIGKVHAIGDEGKVLVVGYKDTVIPVFVTANEYTQGLYRGDIVELSYQIQQYPNRPVHLQLDLDVEQPVKVLDAIASWNSQPKTLTGKLVKFPQSPQLKFDVYAMEVDTQSIKRYFTLINFEDMTEFERIRQKLAKIWDDNSEGGIADRNKLINPQVTIQAEGIANIISTEQANPQILLNSAEDVYVLN